MNGLNPPKLSPNSFPVYGFLAQAEPERQFADLTDLRLVHKTRNEQSFASTMQISQSACSLSTLAYRCTLPAGGDVGDESLTQVRTSRVPTCRPSLLS